MAVAASAAATGEPIALALGAGGARGLAQIGVIEALEARGLRIASVAGSSSGALVGGVYAAGKLREFREGFEKLTRGQFLRLLDPVVGRPGMIRSEEHTSELQSLMRISYAVFCLKKKKNKHTRSQVEKTTQKEHITIIKT